MIWNRKENRRKKIVNRQSGNRRPHKARKSLRVHYSEIKAAANDTVIYDDACSRPNDAGTDENDPMLDDPYDTIPYDDASSRPITAGDGNTVA